MQVYLTNRPLSSFIWYTVVGNTCLDRSITEARFENCLIPHVTDLTSPDFDDDFLCSSSSHVADHTINRA